MYRPKAMAKSWSSEAKAVGPETKAFKCMARVEIKTRSMSDSLSG